MVDHSWGLISVDQRPPSTPWKNPSKAQLRRADPDIALEALSQWETSGWLSDRPIIQVIQVRSQQNWSAPIVDIGSLMPSVWEMAYSTAFDEPNFQRWYLRY